MRVEPWSAGPRRRSSVDALSIRWFAVESCRAATRAPRVRGCAGQARRRAVATGAIVTEAERVFRAVGTQRGNEREDSRERHPRLWDGPRLTIVEPDKRACHEEQQLRLG